MKEQLITFDTAKLAKEKGFRFVTNMVYNQKGQSMPCHSVQSWFESVKPPIDAPTQSLLQKFIRKTRNVHIEVHRNASGYYWSMCIEDGGTDLGWSDMSGPNDSGVWNSFEDSLENALQVQLCYDLPEDKKLIEHWGNYVEFAINHFNTLKL